MRPRPDLSNLSALVVAVVLIGGCGDDETTAPTVDLSGTYELVSATFAGQTVTPPIATGTAILTATTYDIDITVTIPTQQPIVISDEGTYSTSGNTWTQESSTTGGQAVGSFTLVGDVLTVDSVLAGMQVRAVWRRTA